MRLDRVEAVSRWLADSGFLAEALLTELRFVDHGYSVCLAFDLVVDAEGRVRYVPLQVGFELLAVQQLTFDGGLTARMLAHPEEIDWGLSEVARVQVEPLGPGIRFVALWEGERELEIRCRRAILAVPSGSEFDHEPSPGDAVDLPITSGVRVR